MYSVPIGIKAKLRKRDGTILSFYTRKSLTFSPDERVKSEKGTLAFKRRGYLLIVSHQYVKLPLDILQAIHFALKILTGMTGRYNIEACLLYGDEARTASSLARRDSLSTAQAVLGAFIVAKNWRLVPSGIARTATSILWKKWRIE